MARPEDWSYHLLGEKALIVVMTANPEPRDGITLQNADGTITTCYSHRPNAFLVIDTFETQGWVKGILCSQAVSFSCPALDDLIKRPVGSPKGW